MGDKVLPFLLLNRCLFPPSHVQPAFTLVPFLMIRRFQSHTRIRPGHTQFAIFFPTTVLSRSHAACDYTLLAERCHPWWIMSDERNLHQTQSRLGMSPQRLACRGCFHEENATKFLHISTSLPAPPPPLPRFPTTRLPGGRKWCVSST